MRLGDRSIAEAFSDVPHGVTGGMVKGSPPSTQRSARVRSVASTSFTPMITVAPGVRCWSTVAARLRTQYLGRTSHFSRPWYGPRSLEVDDRHRYAKWFSNGLKLSQLGSTQGSGNGKRAVRVGGSIG